MHEDEETHADSHATVEDARAQENWQQIMEFSLPWDMTSSEPSKNFGRHCSDIGFILKGRRGAVQWRAHAQLWLPHDQQRYLLQEKIYGNMSNFALANAPGGIYGTDVGYHSHVPLYADQPIVQQECPYLDGKPCYYDGSGLTAGEWAKEILAVRGARPETVLWPKLEAYYVNIFYHRMTPTTLGSMMRVIGTALGLDEGKDAC